MSWTKGAAQGCMAGMPAPMCMLCLYAHQHTAMCDEPQGSSSPFMVLSTCLAMLQVGS